MTYRLYVVSVRWAKTQVDPLRIDSILTSIGDWIRFDGWTWLVWSDRSSLEIGNTIINRLDREDNVLVVQASEDILNAPNGWAPKWIWDWINDKLNRQRTNSS